MGKTASERRFRSPRQWQAVVSIQAFLIISRVRTCCLMLHPVRTVVTSSCVYAVMTISLFCCFATACHQIWSGTQKINLPQWSLSWHQLWMTVFGVYSSSVSQMYVWNKICKELKSTFNQLCTYQKGTTAHEKEPTSVEQPGRMHVFPLSWSLCSIVNKAIWLPATLSRCL